MPGLQIVLWCSFSGNLQTPSSLGIGCKAKRRKQSPPPQWLSLPWKQLVQPQGKLFPASFGHTQHCAALYAPALPNGPVQSSQLLQGVTPLVPLPQLLLRFCHLARRATHCLPQGPNKGTNTAHPHQHRTREGPGKLLCTSTAASQTSIWVNRETHLTSRQETPYFYFFQLLLPFSSVHWHFCRIRNTRAWI